MKKYLLMSVLFLSFFLGVNGVYALDVCTDDDLDKYRAEAKNVNVTYEVLSEEEKINEEETFTLYYLSLNIMNATENLLFAVDNGTEDDIVYYTFDNAKDGVINIKIDEVDEIQEYEIVINPNYADCADDILDKVSITLPKFNDHSTMAMCEDTPGYKYCQTFIFEEITYNQFYDERNEYIEDLENGTDGTDGEDNNSSDDNFLSNNYIYIIVGILIGVIGIVIFVIYRRKKRIL